MAIRHRLIKVAPEVVWDLLSDPNRYADWVVGTSSSRPVRGTWPQTGAAIRYEVHLGPVSLSNETTVRFRDPGARLELEAHAGILGTARIAIELRPWGEYCLVIVDEHPLQGAGGKWHNFAFEALIHLRHRAMLGRLARLCEDRAGDARRARGPAPVGSATAETEGGT